MKYKPGFDIMSLSIKVFMNRQIGPLFKLSSIDLGIGHQLGDQSAPLLLSTLPEFHVPIHRSMKWTASRESCPPLPSPPCCNTKSRFVSLLKKSVSKSRRRSNPINSGVTYKSFCLLSTSPKKNLLAFYCFCRWILLSASLFCTMSSVDKVCALSLRMRDRGKWGR